MAEQPTVRQPAKPVEPGPSVVDTLKENPLVAWFIGSHAVVRIGVIVALLWCGLPAQVRIGPGLAFH